MHGLVEKWLAAFQRDANTQSSRFFRIINEVPAVLMIVIVVMVVAKPF
jgi:putative membrane protein